MWNDRHDNLSVFVILQSIACIKVTYHKLLLNWQAIKM